MNERLSSPMSPDAKAATQTGTLSPASEKRTYNNIVVLFGSPHRTGNTAKVLSTFMSNRNGGSHVFSYYCYKENPLPCYDCGMCKIGDACANRDLDELMDELKNADYIVIATPLYNNSFPSPLKAVIDRLQRFYNAKFFRKEKEKLKSKTVALIVTCGSCIDDKDELKCMLEKQLSWGLTLLNAKLDSITVIDNLDENELNSDDSNVLFNDAARFFKTT